MKRYWKIFIGHMNKPFYFLSYTLVSAVLLGFSFSTDNSNVIDDNFVKTKGSSFVLNGEKIVFRGAGQWHTAKWNENTYSNLADIGFNSVRLYIDTGNYPESFVPGYEAIDKNIEMARKHGMTVILNVHMSPGSSGISDRGFFMHQERQDLLVDFWRKTAERYKDETIIAGFDIINEPTVRVANVTQVYDCNGIAYLSYFEDYRKIIQRIVDEIREVNKNHTIIVERLWIDGGHFSFGINDQRDCWQNYDGKYNFPDINDPANNYAYTFHCYEPNTWVHQRPRTAVYPSEAFARWNEIDPKTGNPWKMNKAYLDYAYSIPLDYIRNIKNVPAYIGEIGILTWNYDDNDDGTNRGGTQYVEDLYDILLNKYNVSNSWHPFYIVEFHPNMNSNHEASFRKAFGTEKKPK